MMQPSCALAVINVKNTLVTINHSHVTYDIRLLIFMTYDVSDVASQNDVNNVVSQNKILSCLFPVAARV